MAALYPLEIQQGSTFVMQLKFTKSGNNYSIKGIEFVGAVKASVYDAHEYPFRFDVVDDYTVNVYLDAFVSELFEFRKGVYDIKMIQVDGFNTRLLQGTVDVDLGVTNETNYA